MKNPKISIVILLVIAKSLSGFAQDQYKIDGYVYDSESLRALPGTTVFVESLSRGTVSNEDGYYQMMLPGGNFSLTFSFMGYERTTAQVFVAGHQNLDIKLKPLTTTIQEVVISDRHPEEKITETETGLITLTKKELETLPYLMGESDPVRIIQLMPGVQTAGEGSTGFYVRGGAVDQNLILLDNSTVYNPSHLFGFFSVFNGPTISNVDLYKGGIPAYYGGRLSSITKINTRKGDNEQFAGEGTISVIAANLLLEGPIKKGKGSFLVAGRRTYVDLFMDPVRELFSVEEKLDYYFYDLNVNADYDLTTRDQLRFRAYRGKDNFSFGTGSSFSNRIKWGNKTTALQWIHRFSDNLYSELSLQNVSYEMDFGAGINQYHFNILSDIRDTGFTYLFDLTKNRHNITLGFTYTRHGVSPNNIDARSEDVNLDVGNKVRLHANEGAVFLNDKITFSKKLELNAGIRLTGYSQVGPFTRYIQDGNFQILDTVSYSTNETITSYVNAAPRLALRYSLNRSASVKISYDRNFQYMHMAPLSSASLPVDMWVTSSTVVRPQASDQFSAGYFRNFLDNALETSLVAYHKDMRNQLEYRDGVIFGYSKGFNFDDNFVFGNGTSAGIELLIKKTREKLTGMLGYTLSKTTRRFNDLNGGKPFPAKYDRLHDASVMANYRYNEKWTFSGVFVYGTGNALNLPVARYMVQGNVVNEYGSRNSARMPAYHRMDLSATYVPRKTGKFQSSWTFSVYNVYNRRNPYYIYFETKGDVQEYKLETSLKQVSLFPVLPSIAYHFKF